MPHAPASTTLGGSTTSTAQRGVRSRCCHGPRFFRRPSTTHRGGGGLAARTAHLAPARPWPVARPAPAALRCRRRPGHSRARARPRRSARRAGTRPRLLAPPLDASRAPACPTTPRARVGRSRPRPLPALAGPTDYLDTNRSRPEPDARPLRARTNLWPPEEWSPKAPSPAVCCPPSFGLRRRLTCPTSRTPFSPSAADRRSSWAIHGYQGSYLVAARRPERSEPTGVCRLCPAPEG